MIFIDAGALLARYLAHDQYHLAAKEQWTKLEEAADRCCVTSFVISEALTLVGRRSSYAFAAARARSIYGSNLLNIARPEQADEFAAIVYFEKFADQKISFTDCISFAVMKRLKIDTAFAFDRHFVLAGFKTIP